MEISLTDCVPIWNFVVKKKLDKFRSMSSEIKGFVPRLFLFHYSYNINKFQVPPTFFTFFIYRNLSYPSISRNTVCFAS